ncbi:MAG: adenylate/guanylate cyclase domain-containing protein [Stappiaceae bacterium]
MNEKNGQRKELSDWLILSALVERPIGETIRLFAEKLAASGVPVDRINCSTFQRHQIMGAVDTTWERGRGDCKTEFVPKSFIANQSMFDTPAGYIARSQSIFERSNLRNADERAKFAAFKELHDRGYSDYMILKQSYGRDWAFRDTARDSEGVYGSFATKMDGGFSDDHIEEIKALWQTFALCLKTSTEALLSAKLMEAYVGTLAAQNILGGQVERGDGDSIKCVLWYSDLRGSTALSAELPSDEYLELLNRYFDCTAGSVLEQGGEVLKLIGDGVMAIFPYDRGGEAEACSSAMVAAQQSMAKAYDSQQEKDAGGTGNLHFGIGLHAGEVILGNVGTAGRLDMTVTGHSVNQVTRLEALTKTLSMSVLASPQFFELHKDNLISIGRYPVPDLGGMTEIFSLVEK